MLDTSPEYFFIYLFIYLFSVVSLVASVFTLSLIALDRFYGIVFALKAHITERRAQKSLLFVWLCAVVVGSPILVYRNLHTTEWRDHVEKWCNDKWPNPGGANLQYPTLRRIYYTFRSNCAVHSSHAGHDADLFHRHLEA